MSRIRRIAPGLGRGGLIGNTEGPESYLRELDTLPSQFCRATGGTETVIEEADESVSLLLNFDGSNGSTTFTDQSIYAHTVTANGNAQISTTESKFGGSSLYLDGTGDSITQAANSSHGYGTGDFTIEFWLFLNASSLSTIFSHLTSASSTHPHLYIDTTIRFFTASADRITGDSLNTGQWYHIALCRSSGSTRLFIDGTQSGSTYSDTNNYGSTAPLGVGTYLNSGSPVATNTLNGYIDSLRVTKGQALYTGNFTPPASAPTNKTGKYYRVHTFTDTDPTSLLLNFDGANGSTTFTDDSGWGHAVTANGDAQISTTQSKFGGSSAAFDGTGDYLTVSDSLPLRLESGDFTLEGWVYLTSSVDNVGFVAKRQPAAFSGTDWRISYRSASGKFSWDDPSSAELFTPAVSLNTWVHIAFVRIGTTLYCYANGVLGDTGTVSSNFTNTNALTIGRNTAGLEFPGYIDSLRITKGQALYTAAFTPSTTALARVGSGSLTFTRGGAVEYLVVGGGGGGGGYGGGGAGGLRTSTLHPVAATSYSVAVGGGGAGGSNNTGSSGSISEFAAISSAGGGGGAGDDAVDGAAGGSGGGGNRNGGSGGSGNTPSTVPSQGNDGGDSAINGLGGGGGGAFAPGANATAGQAGAGGDGSSSSISGASVAYAGGGGAGANLFAVPSNLPGPGGSGGGGTGGKINDSTVVIAATSGTANSGGGGGGAGRGFGATGGSGGSGIVIARYRITQAEYEAEAA